MFRIIRLSQVFVQPLPTVTRIIDGLLHLLPRALSMFYLKQKTSGHAILTFIHIELSAVTKRITQLDTHTHTQHYQASTTVASAYRWYRRPAHTQAS
jgi:hypothetical protein